MRVKYNLAFRWLEVYVDEERYPKTLFDVTRVELGGQIWYLNGIRERMADQITEILGKEPGDPYDVQGFTFLFPVLKAAKPCMVTDANGENLRENPRREWLEAVRKLESEVAEKVKDLVKGSGKRNYL